MQSTNLLIKCVKYSGLYERVNILVSIKTSQVENALTIVLIHLLFEFKGAGRQKEVCTRFAEGCR